MSMKINKNIKYYHGTISAWPNIDHNCDDTVSVDAEMEFNRFIHLSVCYSMSGKDMEELYGDDDIEYFVDVKGDQMPKLAAKFQALDGDTLVKRIVERFSPFGENAYHKFKEFLDKKGIIYSTSAY